MEGVDGMESTRMRQNRFCFVTSSSNRGSDLVGAEEEEEEEGEEEEEEEGRVRSGRVEEMRDRHNRNDIRRCREKVWSVVRGPCGSVEVEVDVDGCRGKLVSHFVARDSGGCHDATGRLGAPQIRTSTEVGQH